IPKRLRGSDGLDRCRLWSCQSQPGGGSEWPVGDSAHCDRCGSRETRAARRQPQPRSRWPEPALHLVSLCRSRRNRYQTGRRHHLWCRHSNGRRNGDFRLPSPMAVRYWSVLWDGNGAHHPCRDGRWVAPADILSEDHLERARGFRSLELRFTRWLRRLFFQRPHLLQQLVGAPGFVLIHFADREPYVDQHVVAHAGLRHEVQEDLAGDAAELHFADAVPTAIRGLQNFTGYGQTHGEPLLQSSGTRNRRLESDATISFETPPD